MAYRASRNLEASLLDFVNENLTLDGWAGIRTEKSFAEVYKGTLPCICISAIDIRPVKLEIGSKTHIKYYTVNMRIFAKSDGSRLDLSDWLFSKLEDDVAYYLYSVTNGEVTTKTLGGRIIITRWLDNAKELINTENLELEDKYRHLLSFECYIAD